MSPFLLAAYLTATVSGKVTCLKDETDKESANAFFIQGTAGSLLIDAGWGKDAEVPAELASVLKATPTVVTHLHYDHVRRLVSQSHVLLAKQQSSFCEGGVCDLSLWQTVREAPPFRFEREYAAQETLPSGVQAIACSGHSPGDTCFWDPASRTIFPGDLFYLGPLFAFLPGGSLAGNLAALKRILALDWDRVAQTHGDCYATRADVERAVASLEDVAAGKVEGSWDFSFLLPLRVYPIATGAIFLRPFAR